VLNLPLSNKDILTTDSETYDDDIPGNIDKEYDEEAEYEDENHIEEDGERGEEVYVDEKE
jgi:hypothetical protein